MTRHLQELELRGWEPGNESGKRYEADYVIPGDDIQSVEIEERAGVLRDKADLTITNDGGRWTDVVDHGDRIALYVAMDPVDSEGFGEGGFGAGPFGTNLSHRWTGMVRPYTISGSGGAIYELEINGHDFVGAVLGMRLVYDAFEGRPIVGTNGIVNTILSDEAPEIDQSELSPVDAVTDISMSGESLRDVIGELASRAGAIVAARDQAIRFDRPDDLAAKFVLEPADVGPFSIKSSDDTLVNSIRVDGGQDYDVGDTQETVDAYTTVSEGNRAQQQINHRKSEMDRIEIWTRPTGSEESVIVRLQKDDGGVPVAPGNTRMDIARKQLSYEFLAQDDWTTFLMPENDIPGLEPWVLVETDGPDGQEIGINSVDGGLGYRAHHPYPVNVQLPAPASQDKYRRREDRLKDDSITTFAAGQDAGEAELDREKQPDKTVGVEAQSLRAHRLRPGEIVEIHHAPIGADGMYVVAERGQSIEGATLTTDLSLERLPPHLASGVTPVRS